MICILYVHEHTNTSRVAAFTPTDSMEKEKKYSRAFIYQTRETLLLRQKETK